MGSLKMTNQKDSSVKTAKPAEEANKDEAPETTEVSKSDSTIVTVHPLVLLSVVDHFNRMSKIGNQKRVVGVLLGSWSSKTYLDISNSFAVPFDEDERILQFGSLIISILNKCMLCSRRSTLKKELWDGIILVP